MTKWVSQKDRLTSSKEGALLWNQERSILDTTELICEVMENSGVTRTQLAKKLGKTKGYVTQLLDGSTNMTIRTISDVFTVLGHEFVPTCRPLASEQSMRLVASVQIPRDQFSDDASGWIVKFPEINPAWPKAYARKAN